MVYEIIGIQGKGSNYIKEKGLGISQDPENVIPGGLVLIRVA